MTNAMPTGTTPTNPTATTATAGAVGGAAAAMTSSAPATPTSSTPPAPGAAPSNTNFDQMVKDLSSQLPGSTPAAGAPPAPGAGMAGMGSSVPTPPPTAKAVTPPKSGRPPLQSIVAGVVLLLVLIGGGVGFYLSRQNQEVRQQAAGGVVACGDACGDTGYTLGAGINIIDGAYSTPQIPRDYDFHITTTASSTGYGVTTPTVAQTDLYYGGLGRSSAKRWGAAQSFQLNQTGEIQSFSVQLDQTFGVTPTGTISWAIKSNNNGVPGASLASGTFTPAVSSQNTVTITGGPSLTANTTYWLELNSTTDQTNPSYWTWRGGVNAAGSCAADQTCSAGRCVLTACLNGGACSADQCTTTGGNVVPTPTPTPTPTVTPSPTVSSNCSLEFSSTTPSTSITCNKTAYRDEFSNSAGNYSLLSQQSTFNPGDTVVYRINMTNNGQTTAQISLTDPLNASGLNNFTFLDSNCGTGAYDSASRTLNCPATGVNAGQTVSRVFRVKLASTVSAGSTLTNTANVAAGTTTASCSVPVVIAAVASPTPTPSPSPSASPTYSCNSGCSTNAQCQTANTSYICYSGYCRLSTNPTSTTCSYPTVTPTPTVGCNYTCATNADCASSEHICYSGRCRLATYPTSESCTPPVTSSPTTVTTTTTTTTQPVQPTRLPVAGTGDRTLRFFMVGAGAVLLGALGLLLL